MGKTQVLMTVSDFLVLLYNGIIGMGEMEGGEVSHAPMPPIIGNPAAPLYVFKLFSIKMHIKILLQRKFEK